MLALSFAGCSQTSSENVTTQGIYADIRVIAEGNGATVVKARLEVGNGGPVRTLLNLAPGDSLTVVANGIQKTMVKDTSIIGDIEYYASYPFDDADTLFVVSFNRNNGTSAPNSNVTLPDGFIITAPTSADILATSQNVDIAWTPMGTSIVPAVMVTVDCVLATGIRTTGSESIPLSVDGGVASIPVSAAMPIGPFDANQLCEGTVYLSRGRYGTLDPNYGEGGTINAQQHKQGQFFVNPAL